MDWLVEDFTVDRVRFVTDPYCWSTSPSNKLFNYFFSNSLVSNRIEISHLIFEKKKKKKRYLYDFETDPALAPQGWNVSIGKNRWVPCYLLPRFLGQRRGRDRWTEGHRWCPVHPAEISYLRHTVCAEERAAYTYILLAVGLIPLFDNAPRLVSDVRGKNKRRRPSPAPRHPSWPVAASSSSTRLRARCGNEDRSRCAADLYRPLECFMSRAALCGAKQGRAGQGSDALSDSSRAARNSRMRTTSSIADRSQVQGSTRTDSLWSYTRGYTWVTLGLCNAQLLCNGARIFRSELVLRKFWETNLFVSFNIEEIFWRINAEYWSYLDLIVRIWKWKYLFLLSLNVGYSLIS